MSASKNGNGHYSKRTSPLRFCMNRDCRKYMVRSNRFRVWRFNSERDAASLPKFAKADIVLCPECLNNKQLGKVLNIMGGPDMLPARVVKMIGFNQ